MADETNTLPYISINDTTDVEIVSIEVKYNLRDKDGRMRTVDGVEQSPDSIKTLTASDLVGFEPHLQPIATAVALEG